MDISQAPFDVFAIILSYVSGCTPPSVDDLLPLRLVARSWRCSLQAVPCSMFTTDVPIEVLQKIAYIFPKLCSLRFARWEEETGNTSASEPNSSYVFTNLRTLMLSGRTLWFMGSPSSNPHLYQSLRSLQLPEPHDEISNLSSFQNLETLQVYNSYHPLDVLRSVLFLSRLESIEIQCVHFGLHAAYTGCLQDLVSDVKDPFFQQVRSLHVYGFGGVTNPLAREPKPILMMRDFSQFLFKVPKLQELHIEAYDCRVELPYYSELQNLASALTSLSLPVLDFADAVDLRALTALTKLEFRLPDWIYQNDLLRLLGELTTLTRLEKIPVMPSLPAQSFEHLEWFPSLKSIVKVGRYNSFPLSDELLANIKQAHASLEVLHLDLRSIPVVTAIPSIAALTTLTELSLESCNASPPSFMLFTALQRLKSLSFDKVSVDQSSLDVILQCASNLEDLTLQHQPLTSLDSVGRMKNLKVLTIWIDSSTVDVKPLSMLDQLCALHIHCQQSIGPVLSRALFLTRLESLTWHFHSEQPPTISANLARQIGQCKNLTSLRLAPPLSRSCKLTELIQCPKLTDLYLYNLPHIDQLSSLTRCRSLEIIEFGDGIDLKKRYRYLQQRIHRLRMMLPGGYSASEEEEEGKNDEDDEDDADDEENEQEEEAMDKDEDQRPRRSSRLQVIQNKSAAESSDQNNELKRQKQSTRSNSRKRTKEADHEGERARGRGRKKTRTSSRLMKKTQHQ